MEVVVKRGRGRPRKYPRPEEVKPVETVALPPPNSINEGLVTLRVYKTHPEVELPVFGTSQAACFDLKAQLSGKYVYEGYNSNNTRFERSASSGKIIVMPGDRILVPTGLVFDIPVGFSVRVHARSGLSLKKGLVLANSEGVVDSDYVHEGFVMITNVSDNPLEIVHGERIAQAEMVPVYPYKIEETKEAPQKKGDRNGGFGSTGTN